VLFATEEWSHQLAASYCWWKRNGPRDLHFHGLRDQHAQWPLLGRSYRIQGESDMLVLGSKRMKCIDDDAVIEAADIYAILL
jgi:hypothetical protein